MKTNNETLKTVRAEKLSIHKTSWLFNKVFLGTVKYTFLLSLFPIKSRLFYSQAIKLRYELLTQFTVH